MRRTLAAVILSLFAAASCFAQANAEEARKELDAGARAYRYGRFAEAEQRFRRALELDPAGKNTRLFIARAVQQQYKPGDESPENVAVAEKAIAAYGELLSDERHAEDAYKATVFLYGQLKRDDKVRELLLWRANDTAAPNAKRADAFVILASRQWQCSYDVTEQKENKTTESKPDKLLIHYKMPTDAGDFIRARQCVTEGLALAEQAVALDPKSTNALSYKGNLLREAAKLAEMEGDAAQKAEYERQVEEAFAQVSTAGNVTLVPAPVDAPPPPQPAAGPETPGGRRTMINAGILNGKAVSKPMPAYPPAAKAAGVQGTVVVRIVVDEGGNVVEAEAVSGPEPLREAAVTAARHARFSPTSLSGQPVKIRGHVTYNFVLQ
ncbi:MAG TPA: TonB family protein [Pyrinomonadaceae bacterium]|jgi:TonB family protein